MIVERVEVRVEMPKRVKPKASIATLTSWVKAGRIDLMTNEVLTEQEYSQSLENSGAFKSTR